MARPAGLEPATSWFVVVTRTINRKRRSAMKILRINDLWRTLDRPSIAVNKRRKASFEGVTSQTPSQHSLRKGFVANRAAQI
jgi:hypothetical protein